MTSPLILTLGLHPSHLNHIPAHVTLFHHLPGTEGAAVADSVGLAAANQGRFDVGVTGLRPLGRGVAYTLGNAVLGPLRASLARRWQDHLTPQDRQGWRPHVTIQNKADPAEATALLAMMQAAFVPFEVRATGLTLWRYVGGPWELVVRHDFGGGHG